MQNNSPKSQSSAVSQYTCTEYREEMVLLALQRKLQNPDLNQKERKMLEKEIADLETRIGF